MTTTPMPEMPPLPDADSYCTHQDDHQYDVYTADQMQAYARAAIEASQEGDAKDAELLTNMVWNSDDAENPHESIGGFLNNEICNGWLEIGAEFELWRAHRLPTVKIRVTSIDEESCEAEYEVIAAIANKKATQ